MFLYIILFNLLNPLQNNDSINLPSNTNAVESSFASIQFDTKSITLDTLCEGEQGKFKYKYTNVGTSPLILSNVKSSCGCYVPQWSKEPIAPGESSEIIGLYNSRGRSGHFTKTMTVLSNDFAKPTIMLFARGFTKGKVMCQN